MPSLRFLATNVQWVDARDQLGGPATYGQAFLAVDWLIERYGHARLLDFLGRFAVEGGGRWSRMFPVPYGQFIDEFRARLEEMQ